MANEESQILDLVLKIYHLGSSMSTIEQCEKSQQKLICTRTFLFECRLCLYPKISSKTRLHLYSNPSSPDSRTCYREIARLKDFIVRHFVDWTLLFRILESYREHH
ncbi:hypothetical protein OCU04_004759 [Sclerotinia nivalis]|uniref:Uncharacterized protein n=1 Tax=Sclerotinia nivalis TaxID=352851 RepID=A0A9X0AR61_9HELO|nr:hypothetical protein OCU04_004759 [Sclerotinia nivalis]